MFILHLVCALLQVLANQNNQLSNCKNKNQQDAYRTFKICKLNWYPLKAPSLNREFLSKSSTG